MPAYTKPYTYIGPFEIDAAVFDGIVDSRAILSFFPQLDYHGLRGSAAYVHSGFDPATQTIKYSVKFEPTLTPVYTRSDVLSSEITYGNTESDNHLAWIKSLFEAAVATTPALISGFSREKRYHTVPNWQIAEMTGVTPPYSGPSSSSFPTIDRRNFYVGGVAPPNNWHEEVEIWGMALPVARWADEATYGGSNPRWQDMVDAYGATIQAYIDGFAEPTDDQSYIRPIAYEIVKVAQFNSGWFWTAREEGDPPSTPGVVDPVQVGYVRIRYKVRLLHGVNHFVFDGTLDPTFGQDFRPSWVIPAPYYDPYWPPALSFAFYGGYGGSFGTQRSRVFTVPHGTCSGDGSGWKILFKPRWVVPFFSDGEFSDTTTRGRWYRDDTGVTYGTSTTRSISHLKAMTYRYFWANYSTSQVQGREISEADLLTWVPYTTPGSTEDQWTPQYTNAFRGMADGFQGVNYGLALEYDPNADPATWADSFPPFEYYGIPYFETTRSKKVPRRFCELETWLVELGSGGEILRERDISYRYLDTYDAKDADSRYIGTEDFRASANQPVPKWRTVWDDPKRFGRFVFVLRDRWVNLTENQFSQADDNQMDADNPYPKLELENEYFEPVLEVYDATDPTLPMLYRIDLGLDDGGVPIPQTYSYRNNYKRHYYERPALRCNVTEDGSEWAHVVIAESGTDGTGMVCKRTQVVFDPATSGPPTVTHGTGPMSTATEFPTNANIHQFMTTGNRFWWAEGSEVRRTS